MTSRQRKRKKDARSLHQARTGFRWMVFLHSDDSLELSAPAECAPLPFEVGQIEGFRFITSPRV